MGPIFTNSQAMQTLVESNTFGNDWKEGCITSMWSQEWKLGKLGDHHIQIVKPTLPIKIHIVI
jgi:hypothetical protein